MKEQSRNFTAALEFTCLCLILQSLGNLLKPGNKTRKLLLLQIDLKYICSNIDDS